MYVWRWFQGTEDIIIEFGISDSYPISKALVF